MWFPTTLIHRKQFHPVNHASQISSPYYPGWLNPTSFCKPIKTWRDSPLPWYAVNDFKPHRAMRPWYLLHFTQVGWYKKTLEGAVPRNKVSFVMTLYSFWDKLPVFPGVSPFIDNLIVRAVPPPLSGVEFCTGFLGVGHPTSTQGQLMLGDPARFI